MRKNLEILIEQLAPGQTDLAHPMGDKLPRHPSDFLKGQQVAMRQVGIVLVKNLLGHAIAATEVAAVGHADAQVGQVAAQGIGQQAGGQHRPPSHAVSSNGGEPGQALVDQRNHTFGHALIVANFDRMTGTGQNSLLRILATLLSG